MWRRRRSQRDFEEEIRSHLELEADRLVAEGHSAIDAPLAAKRRFGNVGVAQERYRDSDRFAALIDLGNDVRYAARMLRKAPGFTAIAMLTLALGIGANTAVFSVVNGVLLKSLPYRDPSRIVRVWETLPSVEQIMVSYPDYQDWRTRARVFDDIALFSPFRSMTMSGTALPERLSVGYATANLFGMLGVAPLAGRDFLIDDDRPSAARVAVLSEGWWRRQFGGEQSVIGRSLVLDGETYSVVGVIGPTVGLQRPVDLWIPMGLFANAPHFGRANHPGLIGIGRLKPGITIAQMRDDLERVSAQIRAEHPSESAGVGASGQFLTEYLLGGLRPALRMLVWAVALVLLIACVNVANLLLGRSTARRREIAVRTAMGASGGRLVRLLLVEHLLLALGGGLLGMALAYAGVRALLALKPTGIPRLESIAVDWQVMGFAAVVSMATGLAFGLLPALQASRVDLNDALKDGGRGASAGGSALRVRGALMTVEVAMAMMLVVGAGLLFRSFVRLAHVDPGVNATGLMVGWVNLPPAKYRDAAQQRAAMNDVLRRVQALPGVQSAALGTAVPLGASIQYRMTFEGHPRPVGKEPLININLITSDFFKTLGIRLLAGRSIAASDGGGTPRVAVISESVAQTYFPGEDPVGKQIVHGSFESKDPPYTVVGVVSDIKEESLDWKTGGMIYLAFDQDPLNWIRLIVRSPLEPEQLTPALRGALAGFDRELPLSDPQTLEDAIAQSIGQERFVTLMIGVFAIVALLLAAIGVYGVIAYFVAQRTHEFGIRMALGARRADIVSLIGKRVLATTALGVAIGLAGAVAASDLMTKLLFEITALDATTYATGALTLLAAAALAAVVPTLRATKVNPACAMRGE
jgi:putative ABC transport system permease protein